MNERQRLLDKRAKAWADAEDFRRRGDDLGESDRQAWNDALSQVERIDDQLEALGGDGSTDARVAAPIGANARVDDVPLLRRDQTLADWVRRHGPQHDDAADQVRLGSMLRSWVTGNREHLNEAESRAMSEGTSSAGGVLVPTPTAARFIDRARNAASVTRAGATIVPMESQTLKVPRLTGSSAPAWRSESAAVATGDLSFDSVTLTAQSLAFLVKLSRELIEDSDPSAASIVERDLAAQLALEWDRVALRGTGTAPEPRGVRNQSGVTVTAFGGANGATPTNYDPFIDAEQVVRANNYEPSATILSSRTQGTVRKLKEATTNAYLARPADLSPWLVSNQIPGNLTAGTSSDTSEVYVGDWPMLYLGVRTGPLTIQLNERYADTGQVGLLIWFRGDIACAQPGAFNVLTGVRP